MTITTHGFPSRIKDVYIEINDYQFNHRSISNGSGKPFKHFIGRSKVKERIKMLLSHSLNCASGAYLITGYRGMGKTSLVDQVITELNLPSIIYKKIDISLSQDDVKDMDVLRLMARQLYRAFVELARSDEYTQLGEKADKRNNEFNHIFMDLQKLSKILYGNFKEQNGRVGVDLREIELNLDDNLRTKVTDNQELIRFAATPKEIEKELIYILDNIDKLRTDMKEAGISFSIPYFIFVVDELDKIEPHYFNDSYSNKNEKINNGNSDLSGGINKVRKRQEVVAHLLSNLKSFLNTAQAKFIFIGGREMYDAALADIADRDSFYSSIFHDVIYVNSFFKDKFSKKSGVTRMTEGYLCKLILSGRIEDENHDEEEILNLSTVYKYLVSQKESKILSGRKEDKDKAIYKIILLLQNFVIYLTYRSNGVPKKLVSLVESYMCRLNNKSIQKLQENEIVLTLNNNDDKNENRLFIKMTYNKQYEIGLTSNLYRPYVIIHSRYLKSLGDKLLYSTAFIMDYLLKYHPNAFSWRNLEMIPEIILVNKDPNLRYFLEDILKFLFGKHIRETVNGIFQYKYYSKTANEIKLLTKISESASAAFSFTLDETLQIKGYYKQKLNELKKENPHYTHDYIHSIGFLQSVLGDLHYFDKEYDEALTYYADSVQILRNLAQNDSKKLTKHQTVLYVRHELMLGLCLEKIKDYDSTYSIYRGLILNIPFILDKSTYEHENPIQYVKDNGEWDKPVRRMQLFIKPHISLLDLIEKQRMDGITYANLSRNFQEVYSFLIDNKNREKNVQIGSSIRLNTGDIDSVRVHTLLSDYYNNVGSLLFSKNKNFEEIFTLLKNEKFTSSVSDTLLGTLNVFQNESKGHYLPSFSAFLYYLLSLKELLKPYEKEITLLPTFVKNPFDNNSNYFSKAIYLLLPQAEGIINTTVFYNFANLFAKIGDALLGCISENQFKSYKISDATFNLFGHVENNEIYRRDNEELILKQIHDKLAEAKNLEDFCKLDFILVIYRAAGCFYRKANRSYSYGFQYKKFFLVVKDYIAFVDDETRNLQGMVNNKKRYFFILDICEEVAVKIFNINTWLVDVANRPQILKYKEIFDNRKLFENEKEQFSNEQIRTINLNISTSTEIKETIVLVEEIKLKIKNIINEEKLYDNNNSYKTQITPYDLVTSRFTRVNELRFQCDNNYFILKNKKVINILKSQIITDLNMLGIDVVKDDRMLKIREGIKAIIVKYYKDKRKGSNHKIKTFQLHDFIHIQENRLRKKVANIEREIDDRIKNCCIDEKIKFDNSLFESQFNEFYLSNYINSLKDANVREIICDSIFCLFELIRTLNLFGLNYITNHSYLANSHFKLANWCQAYLNYKILVDQEKEISNDVENPTIYQALKQVLGEEELYYIEPNYHNELAIQHYYSAIQTHNGGLAYRSITQSMSFLEDDFNDNLTHFCAATERFRINTGFIKTKIDKLKRKIQYSNMYDYNNYLFDDNSL